MCLGMTFTSGGKGGEYEHQLTVDEMPYHEHGQKVSANNGSAAIRRDYSSDGSSDTYSQGCNTYGAGNNHSHNNIQPYIGTHYWRRLS